MDLNAIKSVIDKKDISDQVKESVIISILASDANVIPKILRILDAERQESHELINNMNEELSKAFIVVEDSTKTFKKKKGKMDPNFVDGKIRDFYLKWQHRVRCIFKMDGLP